MTTILSRISTVAICLTFVRWIAVWARRPVWTDRTRIEAVLGTSVRVDGLIGAWPGAEMSCVVAFKLQELVVAVQFRGGIGSLAVKHVN